MPKRTKVIGLTGSIGMGKSSVASMFEREGAAVFDSDAYVHELYAKGGKAVRLIREKFPQSYNRKTGSIDRTILREFIFTESEDPEHQYECALNKQWLESIIHPLVQQGQAHYIRHMTAQQKRLIVLDIPLLFETNAQQRLDGVAVVTAPADLQMRRVLNRPGMTYEKFCKINMAQMSDNEKCRRADYIIQTGCHKARTMQQVRAIAQKFK